MGQGLRSVWKLGLAEAREALQSPRVPPGLQSQETGPCSFVYKCRVAFGEQGCLQKKGKRSGGKEEGLCSLPPP